ncbi:MAG TPA: ATP-binding protein [Bdellovibrionota bacterium]|nr:ATP-binding protein [Bdellovibrionota bacterium]
MSDIKRSAINSVSYLMKKFPAVAILGARQVGKTTLLHQLLPGAPFFDLEREVDYERIKSDPEFFLSQYTETIVLDEAQLCSELFPAMRVSIDKRRKINGQYLLSGSSSPLLTKSLSESLAGRVAIFELSQLHLQECWGYTASFYDWLIDKNGENCEDIKPITTWDQLIQSCYYGGFPDPFLQREDIKYFGLWMSNYFKTYIERDIRKLFSGLNTDVYRRFIRMLANSSGSILKASNFSKSLDVSEPTVKSYLEIAEGTFLWRTLPSFRKNLKKRLVKMPKGHIRDTGLLNYLSNIADAESLKAHPFFGSIWEVFIIEQIIRGLQSRLVDFRYYYYRTHNQAEVDLILEGPFGLIPIEIKLGMRIGREQIVTLEKFVKEYKCPFGLIINNGDKPQSLSPGIIQIPATCL